MMKLLPRSQD